jgi:hypothetical protein
MFKDSRILIVLMVITVVYIAMLPLSSYGYGYAGYGGYHHGPSFWYWGGARDHYVGTSVREGSLGGPGRNAGISGGK